MENTVLTDEILSQLSQLTVAEFQKLKVWIVKEEDRRKSQLKQDMLARFEQMAADYGMARNELLSVIAPNVQAAAASSKQKRKRKFFYRLPENADLVWSGFGHQPKWLSDYLQSNPGKTLEDLRVATGE